MRSVTPFSVHSMWDQIAVTNTGHIALLTLGIGLEILLDTACDNNFINKSFDVSFSGS